MLQKLLLSLCIVLALSFGCSAREIAGVEVAETLTTDEGTSLVLNGAGVRKKLIFEVYIAELYLQEKMSSAQEILADEGPKRILMHFLYKEIEPKKLVDAWNEGFDANLDTSHHAALQSEIDTFNSYFETVKRGDQVVVDYIPGRGTQVKLKGEIKGVIAGKEFNDALLSIWLGEEPVTTKLKNELLGK